MDIAGSMNNIANVKVKMNEINEALELYEKALKLLKGKFRGRNQDVVGCLNNIGNLYWMLGDKKKADEMYQEASNVKN